VEMRLPQGAPAPAWRAAADGPDPATLAATAVEPLGEGGFLVAAAWRAATSAVWLVSPEGRATLLFDDPERDEIEAIASRPAPPPRGRPSGREPGRPATLICYDARRGDGTIGPGPDRAAPVRVTLEALDSDRGPAPAAPVELGSAPVLADGSFQVQVPPDLPIRVRSLDAEGREIGRSDWFWMRPGEVRACFGCHEDRASAPVNHTVQALAEAPVGLDAGGEARAR